MQGLDGTRWVRAFGPALREANKWWPRPRHRMEVRKHALKLRYWPEHNPADSAGQVLDVDWEWIRACRADSIGELRIDDTIGGQDNIRVVFFVAPKRKSDPMPIIWILAAFPKRRQEWTAAQVTTFRARKRMVDERFYSL